MQPVETSPPTAKRHNRRQTAVIGADLLRWIATCWQSVYFYKLAASYFHTFAGLSESDFCEYELAHDCLETGCLLPGDLCNHLDVESGRCNYL